MKNENNKQDPNKTGKIGGQFNNKNAEKWTEIEALKLANETIEWLMPLIEYSKEKGKDIDLHFQNVFYLEFITLYKRLNRGTIEYLAEKFKSFSALYSTIKNIQEAKLQKLGSFSKSVNPYIIGLVLKAKHDYKEKTETEIKGTIENKTDLDNLPIEKKKQILKIMETNEG